MSFISYAQNFEDVMLWRALKNVKNGFYVDVGAAWPDEHSVTKAFYDKGWSGVNIEPNPNFHIKLKQQRERDTNLQVALGKENGHSNINIIENTGLSTLAHDIASTHQDHGWKTSSIPIEIQTLSHIWQAHIGNNQTVHFLKIDVEGLEQAVLQSNNWAKNRPWIVVIESTLPMTNIECHHMWESILLENSYIFVYADGLNRFYVANEHHELVSTFKYPPNVFDNFILAQQHTAENRATQAENRVAQAENRVAQAENRVAQAENRATQAEKQLQDIILSKSCQITAPLRWFAHQVRILKERGIKSRAKAVIKKLGIPFAKKCITLANNHPKQRHQLIVLSKKLGIHSKLKIAYHKIVYGQPISAEVNSTYCPYEKEEYLSESAREIHKKLIAAIEANRRL